MQLYSWKKLTHKISSKKDQIWARSCLKFDGLTRRIWIFFRRSNSFWSRILKMTLNIVLDPAVIDFFLQIFIVCVKFLKPEPITLGQKFLWKITSIYMLKIFHKIFFENLTISIPAFQTAKKFGLLNRSRRFYHPNGHCQENTPNFKT